MTKLYPYEPLWFFKWRNPEFWSTGLVHAIPFLYQAFHTLRLGNHYYPFLLNPAIGKEGGFSELNKLAINALFPKQYLPESILWQPEQNKEALLEQIKTTFGFPCFAKPTDLFRGIGVQKIDNESAFLNYVDKFPAEILFQEWVQYPNEFAVFIARIPGKPLRILSLTGKEFLSITGDGVSTIEALLKQNFRYILAQKLIKPQWLHRFHEVPHLGHNIIIQPVGNHNTGTKFLDLSPAINPDMEAFFNSIVPEGIHYGRFDIKADDLASLSVGHNLKIIEFNGTIADPVSYLDPAYGFWKGQELFLKHMKVQLAVGVEIMKEKKSAPGLLQYLKSMWTLRNKNKKNSFTFE